MGDSITDPQILASLQPPHLLQASVSTTVLSLPLSRGSADRQQHEGPDSVFVWWRCRAHGNMQGFFFSSPCSKPYLLVSHHGAGCVLSPASLLGKAAQRAISCNRVCDSRCEQGLNAAGMHSRIPGLAYSTCRSASQEGWHSTGALAQPCCDALGSKVLCLPLISANVNAKQPLCSALVSRGAAGRQRVSRKL